jgi:hypothetical protein
MSWISVEERLPDKSGDTLTKNKHGQKNVFYYSSFNGAWTHGGRIQEGVTHWREIEPPGDEDE